LLVATTTPLTNAGKADTSLDRTPAKHRVRDPM
jgi:hypothetical protein